MSDYQKQLADLDHKRKELIEKRHKLDEEEKQILEKRKHAVLRLIERFKILRLPDEVLCGAFVEIEAAADGQSEKLKLWAEAGKAFVKPRKQAETEKPIPAGTTA